jgi:hypothetical protein
LVSLAKKDFSERKKISVYHAKNPRAPKKINLPAAKDGTISSATEEFTNLEQEINFLWEVNFSLMCDFLLTQKMFIKQQKLFSAHRRYIFEILIILYTLKTPVFEIASVLENVRVEIFVLHNGKFCLENFS